MAKIQHTDDPEMVGKRLKTLREERGLSQRDLAGPGCDYAFISRIETGARTPSTPALEYLAEQLGTSARYLATGELEPWQHGLADAGLTIDRLDALHREVLWRSIADAERHAAKIVGQTIQEQRVDDAIAAYRAGVDLEAAIEAARAPYSDTHDRLVDADHVEHQRNAEAAA